MVNILRFGALRVGRRKTFKMRDGTKESLPYILWDHEPWPFANESMQKARLIGRAVGQGPELIDDNGFAKAPRWWLSTKRGALTRTALKVLLRTQGKALDESDIILKAEMDRLAQRWEEWK